jgi:nitroreductase
MLRDLVIQTRTYRRFDEKTPVSRETLIELVDLARLSASGGNNQPLKYFLACDPKTNDAIFPHLAWAGYLTDWPGPEPGQRPAAYIVILLDTQISASPGCDQGIAAQSIVLGAMERGLGACMIGSIQRPKLAQALKLPDRFQISLVIALGEPAEKVVLETVGADGDVKYWRDADGAHHVPKRPLDDVIIN